MVGADLGRCIFCQGSALVRQGRTTYDRLRETLAGKFVPRRLVRSVRLHHQQLYNYRIHRGKLFSLLVDTQYSCFQPLGTFLDEMARACPHDLFQGDSRASQGKTVYAPEGVECPQLKKLMAALAPGDVVVTFLPPVRFAAPPRRIWQRNLRPRLSLSCFMRRAEEQSWRAFPVMAAPKKFKKKKQRMMAPAV